MEMNHAAAELALDGCASLRGANLHYAKRAIGGAEGIRTPDLLTASQTRSQLRHGPT